MTDTVAAPSARATLARADGVTLIGEVSGSGYRTPPSLARRADGQVVQLTALLYAVLAAVDGRRRPDEVAAVVSDAVDRHVTADDVLTLVDGRLRPLGLMTTADGAQPQVRRTNPLLALRLKWVVTDPRVTRRLTAPFAALFAPAVVVLVTLAFLATAGWVLFEKGLAAATHEAFDRPGLLLLVFAVTVLSAGFHEFGHAAACRYGGATPGAMGAGLYLVWPAFYTEVTDSYRLDRRGRLRVDLGGLYFNALVALAMFGIWSVTRFDAWLLVIATQVLQMVRQLTPLVRFDGYHVLADLTGVPDLFHHIKPILVSLWPTRRRRGEASALKPWARTVVTVWVLLVVPLLTLSAVLMVMAFPRVAATAWAGVQKQWAGLEVATAAGDGVGVTTKVLGVLAIALPVLATVYLVVRLIRRMVTGTVRWSAGHPWRRVVALLLTGAVVAGLGYAWWPAPQTYRPIQATEQGTVLTGLTRLTQQRPAVPAMRLQEGDVVRTRTIWAGSDGLTAPVGSADSGAGSAGGPAGSTGGVVGGTTTPGTTPTEADPALAMVLVPSDPDSDAPTWVFPFEPPDAPEAGDNQALAVNTTDGSVVYDVAFALVWVDGADDVLSTNEAWALASCTGCAAVAVGFQVVLVVGQADVVVPQNLSVAVNYDCVGCLTYALAQQLVVTLPGRLGDDAMAELEQVWADLARFGQDIADVPLSELQARLAEFERQILAIVVTDGGGSVADVADAQEKVDDQLEDQRLDGQVGDVDAGDTSADRPAGDESPAPGATSSSADPSVGGGGEPTATASTATSTATSASPSESPSPEPTVTSGSASSAPSGSPTAAATASP